MNSLKSILRQDYVVIGGKFMDFGGWSSWQVFTLIFCIVTALVIGIANRKNKK